MFRPLVPLLLIVILAITIPHFLPRLRLLASHIAQREFRNTAAALTKPLAANMSPDYSKELNVALLAVQRATLLTRSVFNSHAKGTLSKSDASPVTIGDFGAQALIIAALQHNFPEDEIVAEEEAKDLSENSQLRDLVYGLVTDAKLDSEGAEQELGGAVKSAESMLHTIDKGSSLGGNKGRIWAIDPIDGTKGFLRGGQYAVCLALMVDGDVKLGVLGCPNLPVSDSEALTENIGADATDAEGKGVIFSAVLGKGATSRALGKGGLADPHPIHMKPVSDVADATFCESVESGHSNQSDSVQIALKLGITKPSVRMDSQAKYGSIARGAGDLYLRLPVKKTYVEKIWDHAAGDLIVREAGGEVTDVEGKRLNFGLGRTLKENKGVVAAPKDVHSKVLQAVKEVLNAKAL